MYARLRTPHSMAVLLLAAMLACSRDSTITDPVTTVASVELSPRRPSVAVRQSVALSATLRDASGTPITGPLVRWESGDGSVASVTQQGEVTGVAVGTTTVRAVSQGKVATATITVTTGPAPVARIDLAVAAVVLGPGATQQLVATPRDAEGHELVGREMAWSSSQPSVATVGTTGVVTAVSNGTATITVTSEGKHAEATVTVAAGAARVERVDLDVARAELAEGATRTLVATPKDAAGQVVSGRAVQWTTSDEGIAYVTPGGTVTAVRVGTATITARVEGKFAAATVVITADYDFELLYDGWSGIAGQGPELYRLNIRAPGSMPARLRPGAYATDVSPSPDGRRMTFVGYPNEHPQIYVANIDGTEARRLTTTLARDDEPAWSPDGTKIAFRRWDLAGTGDSDVWVMNADGTDARSLTADLGRTNQTGPAWSPRLPDGSHRIVLSSQTNNAAGEAHLWTMRADGTDKRQLTTGHVFDDQAAWSPDGTTIAFSRHGATAFLGLQLVRADGTNLRPLLRAPFSFAQFAPAWSPDGRLIAFTSKEGGLHQVYSVWPDGSNVARRTFDDTDKGHPAWVRRQP